MMSGEWICRSPNVLIVCKVTTCTAGMSLITHLERMTPCPSSPPNISVRLVISIVRRTDDQSIPASRLQATPQIRGQNLWSFGSQRNVLKNDKPVYDMAQHLSSTHRTGREVLG
jgi:hypothetical protein